jgi:hypothetical protein
MSPATDVGDKTVPIRFAGLEVLNAEAPASQSAVQLAGVQPSFSAPIQQGVVIKSFHGDAPDYLAAR